MVSQVKDLPVISAASKDNIMSVKKAAGVEDKRAPAPLFSAEWKPRELWQTILKDLKVDTVEDFSPGSGQLAAACLQQQVYYTGFVDNQDHFNWLIEMTDFAAVRLVIDGQTGLYHQTLAEVLVRPAMTGSQEN